MNLTTVIILVAVISVIAIIVSVVCNKAGKVEKKEIVKEEGRYYFYNDRCSFKLPKEEIMKSEVEKDGLKHTLSTVHMMLVIIEIRPGMPSFGDPSIPTWETTIAGYPCLVAKVRLSRQYFINCKDFVVQVSPTIYDEDFLNTFRIEK